MAPRQLLLELEEVDMAAEKGSKRVRVDRADDSSMQVRLPTRATACITLLTLPSALDPQMFPYLDRIRISATSQNNNCGVARVHKHGSSYSFGDNHTPH
eukprot:scaffold9555_cov123-Isochrysis_galbana.AAC.8